MRLPLSKFYNFILNFKENTDMTDMFWMYMKFWAWTEMLLEYIQAVKGATSTCNKKTHKMVLVDANILFGDWFL